MLSRKAAGEILSLNRHSLTTFEFPASESSPEVRKLQEIGIKQALRTIWSLLKKIPRILKDIYDEEYEDGYSGI